MKKSLTAKDAMNINKTNDFVKFVETLGYTQTSRSGSHMVFRATGKSPLSIPDKRELAPGTRRNLVKLIFGDGYYG